MPDKRLFLFGLGYSSQAIAMEAMAQGFSVAGTSRSLEKRALLTAQGIDAYAPDAIPSAILQDATHILSSIPTQEGQGDLALPLLPPSTHSWLGYLSTTGVYGDWQGAWVDETSEVRPNNDRLKRRVEAEEAWRARGGHVFRLSGIYGAGRSAIDDVQVGEARRIDKSGQVFSRIHVDDIAQVVLASMHQPNPSTIYNVCDDEPAPSHEVVAYACELLGVTPPPLIPYEQANLSAMAREFYAANRRVSNARIKKELGIVLHYPTYREGLRAIAGMA